jgi:hypothetical protein
MVTVDIKDRSMYEELTSIYLTNRGFTKEQRKVYTVE